MPTESTSTPQPTSARPSIVNSIAAIESRPMVRSIALTGLFVMACVAVLWLARVVFIPLTFALMLSFVFRPFVRLLERGRIPTAVGGTIVVLVLVTGSGLAATQLAEPATTWAERLPRALQSVERKIRPLKRPVDKVSALAESVERITDIDKTKRSREVRLEEPGLVSSALETFATLAGAAVVMVIALYFMLIWGDGLLSRIVSFVPDLQSQRRASQVLQVIERRMSTYLGTICAINLVLGVAVAISSSALGMPNPLLWGVLAAVLNFVPYLGSLFGVAVLAVAAVATFNDLSQAMYPPLAYLAITAVEGNIVTPIILGRQFRINPLVIFVWLVFWAWLWGVSGGILAVPLLMLIKLTCEQSPTLTPVVEFLRR